MFIWKCIAHLLFINMLVCYYITNTNLNICVPAVNMIETGLMLTLASPNQIKSIGVRNKGHGLLFRFRSLHEQAISQTQLENPTRTWKICHQLGHVCDQRRQFRGGELLLSWRYEIIVSFLTFFIWLIIHKIITFIMLWFIFIVWNTGYMFGSFVLIFNMVCEIIVNYLFCGFYHIVRLKQSNIGALWPSLYLLNFSHQVFCNIK